MSAENYENINRKFPHSLSFKRLYSEVRDEEIERAIDYLVFNIPEDVLREVFEKSKQNFDFVGKEHFGLGVDIRNLLYRGKFDLGGNSMIIGYIFYGELQKRCTEKKNKHGFSNIKHV